MKELLSILFKKAIELRDFEFDSVKAKNNWLGNGTLIKGEIEGFEKKLKVTLPSDFKELLLLTNGFPALTNIDPSFLRIKEIIHFRNYKYFDLELWNDPDSKLEYEQLKRCLLVGGMNEDQQFLIVPPLKNEKWLYFHYANWNPGIEKYNNLKDYFESVIEFMSEEMNNKY